MLSLPCTRLSVDLYMTFGALYIASGLPHMTCDAENMVFAQLYMTFGCGNGPQIWLAREMQRSKERCERAVWIRSRADVGKFPCWVQLTP